jgi:DNA-directed RNA polymerase subunit RPC12/RpoP
MTQIPPPDPGLPPVIPGTYRCPRCGSEAPPLKTRRISTAGWVTFGVLMFLCLPLFWIGLLIQEDYFSCPACGARAA